MDIDEEFERFIEFPSDSNEFVTSASAKLFAKHCVEKLELATRDTDKKNLATFLKDDAHAATFQSLAQYRKAVLECLNL